MNEPTEPEPEASVDAWRSVPAPLNIRNRDYLQGSGRNGSGPA